MTHLAHHLQLSQPSPATCIFLFFFLLILIVISVLHLSVTRPIHPFIALHPFIRRIVLFLLPFRSLSSMDCYVSRLSIINSLCACVSVCVLLCELLRDLMTEQDQRLIRPDSQPVAGELIESGSVATCFSCPSPSTRVSSFFWFRPFSLFVFSFCSSVGFIVRLPILFSIFCCCG